MGDLNQNNPLKITGPSIGIYGKRNFSAYAGLRLNYTYGQISGNDANSSNEQFRERNLKFKTSLSELSTILDINFFDFPINDYKRITPYVFAGVGFVVFKPKVEFDGKTYRLDRYATEGQENGYKNFALTIPYGAGVRYNYRENWSVFSEIGYRTAHTDYLDDVSGVYPVNPVIITSGDQQLNLSDPSAAKIGVPGTQRGDFRKRDTYLFVSIGISFTFVSSKCFSF